MIIKNGLIYLLERMLSKKILFSRHAKSSWGKLGLSDHDRPLSQRGLENAHLILENDRKMPIYAGKMPGNAR